jgi:hypothetical protein
MGQELAKANIGYFCAVDFRTKPANRSDPFSQLSTG